MSGHKCRVCEQSLNRVFVDLGMSPLSNSYLRAEQLHQMEPFYPLRVFVCERCFSVQLPEFEKASAIFGDEYLYFSSYSQSWLAHCEAYAKMMASRFRLASDDLVVELASNDGYLLQYFKAQNIDVLGIEPAANVAKVAIEERQIPTEVRFFGAQTAQDLVAKGHRARVIAANNVLAHVPDIHDFVEGMRILLAPQGVVTVEFPHLMRLMDNNQFDTIYHEHFSYISFVMARKVFEAHQMVVFDVEELGTHGGSLRVFARHQADSAKAVSNRVVDLVEREKDQGYESLQTYLGFRPRVEAIKRDLLEFLIKAKREGKRVVGYGAPAKGNTLLNYCGVREDLLEFTVDRSPHKQGLFLPGTHIPILAPEAIAEAKPDYVLILPWNLRTEITGQMAHIRDWGGKFVVPIPGVEVF